jgi:tetratricopeptide (TPR) repeat protein
MPADIDSPDKHSELAERLDEAEALALKILATQPENPDALNGLGLIHVQQEQFDKAIELFDRAHKIDQDRGDFTDNLIKAFESAAQSMTHAARYPAAIKTLERALVMRPGDVTLTCRMSFVLSAAKRNGEALAAADRALSKNSESAEAHDVRGLALLGLGQVEHAITSFRTALDFDLRYAPAYSNLGLAYRAQGEPRDAISCFDEAIRLDENNPGAYNNLGISLLDVNDLTQAETALRSALSIEPDYAEANYNLSRVLLMAEDFETGWKQNEWRWLCADFPSAWREFPQAMWQGEDLIHKKIFVWSEQGIGDEIMFANTLPELVQKSGEVIIECNNRLVPIFERSFDGVTAVARQEPTDSQIENTDADFQIPVGSICKLYRKTAEDFPTEPGGYLKSDPDLTAEITARYASLGDGMKVGISWRSGNPIVGHERSIPLGFWDEILSLDGCQFVNLQYGEVAEDLAGVLARTGVTVFKDDAVDPLTSAEEWFAQISALDHVISVDNSTIQVSGSLGVPTWTLLSEVPEWRFGLKRLDHLWHPSVRVFRQHKKGEWELLMKEVAFTFAALLENEGYVTP